MNIRSNHDHPIEGPVVVLHSPNTTVYFGLQDDPVHAFGPFESEEEAFEVTSLYPDDHCEKLIIPLIIPPRLS